jgi:toxin CptA
LLTNQGASGEFVVPVKLQVTIGPSRTLAALLAAFHATALVVISIVTLPTWAKLLFAAAIITSGGLSIWCAALRRSRSAITEIEAGEGSRIACRTRDDRWREVEVLPSSFISPWLTVLNLRVPGAMFATHVLILPDNVETDAFRRLRVLLKWSRQAPASSRPPEDIRH